MFVVEMRKKCSIQVVPWLISVMSMGFFLSGCEENKRGHFEGQLTVYSDFSSSNTGKDGNGWVRAFKGTKWVAVDVTRSGRMGTIEIRSPKGNENELLMEPIEITKSGVRGIHLSMPSIRGEFDLKKDGECYGGHTKRKRGKKEINEYHVTACLNLEESIEITVSNPVTGSLIFELFADPYSQTTAPQGPLDIKKAVDIALATNPASQAEFERKMQAKYNSLSSWLRATTPQISLPSQIGMALESLNPLGYIQAIGNLAPFLSMGLWINAFEARLQNKVAYYSFKIAQADLATLVEGLVYAYRHDLAIWSKFNKLLEESKIIRAKVEEIERQGEIDHQDYITKGSSVTMDTMVKGIEVALGDMKSLIAADKYALLRALGIHDIEHIRNIKIGCEENSIETAQPLLEGPTVNQAKQVSLERKQKVFAIEISEVEKKALFLRLIDPVGDPSKGLGIQTIWDNLGNISKIKELRFEMKDLNNRIEQGVRLSVAQYNTNLDNYKIAKKIVEANDQITDRVLDMIKSFDPKTFTNTITAEFDIFGVFQADMAAIIQLKNYLVGFRIARATLDRMLLKGYYSEVEKDSNGRGLVPPSPIDSPVGIVPTPHSPICSPEDDDIEDTTKIEGEEDQYILYRIPFDNFVNSFEERIRNFNRLNINMNMN